MSVSMKGRSWEGSRLSIEGRLGLYIGTFVAAIIILIGVLTYLSFEAHAAANKAAMDGTYIEGLSIIETHRSVLNGQDIMTLSHFLTSEIDGNRTILCAIAQVIHDTTPAVEKYCGKKG
jgi:hypothetical protein